MIPVDDQRKFSDALRAVLEENTSARRRELWSVFAAPFNRADELAAEVERLTAQLAAAGEG